MRILTLFLALFLTLLPDSVSYANTPLGQDVFMEEICDVEGDAVLIHMSQRREVGVRDFSEIVKTEWTPVSIQVLPYHPIRFCFERQWLTACTLRL